MSDRRRLSSVALLVVASCLAGCVVAVAPPRQPLSEDARRALDVLTERWRNFSDLRALADITVEQGSRRDRLTGVLLAKAPASVRFEALSPFGQPFLLVTIHDGRLIAYDATANEATIGPATAETAARLLKLPLDPDDLVAVLSGRAAPPRDLRQAEILPPDERGPSLSMVGGLHEQRVWMNFQTGVAQQIQITGGRIDARVTYDLDETGRLRGFTISAAQSWLTGTVRYRDVVVDGGVDPERFAFAVPKGAKIHEIR